jgi:hypothetical protein
VNNILIPVSNLKHNPVPVKRLVRIPIHDEIEVKSANNDVVDTLNKSKSHKESVEKVKIAVDLKETNKSEHHISEQLDESSEDKKNENLKRNMIVNDEDIEETILKKLPNLMQSIIDRKIKSDSLHADSIKTKVIEKHNKEEIQPLSVEYKNVENGIGSPMIDVTEKDTVVRSSENTTKHNEPTERKCIDEKKSIKIHHHEKHLASEDIKNIQHQSTDVTERKSVKESKIDKDIKEQLIKPIIERQAKACITKVEKEVNQVEKEANQVEKDANKNLLHGCNVNGKIL